MSRFAYGSRAIALCDRCGFQYKYLQLQKEWNGLRTCPECWEIKHPQLMPIFPPTEPQALMEPRPSRFEPMEVLVGQQIFPLPNNDSLQGITVVGLVTVGIS